MDADGVIYGASTPDRFKFVAEDRVEVGDYVEVVLPEGTDAPHGPPTDAPHVADRPSVVDEAIAAEDEGADAATSGADGNGTDPAAYPHQAQATALDPASPRPAASTSAAGSVSSSCVILAQVEDVTYRSNLPADSALALEAPDPGPLRAEARVLGYRNGRGVEAPRAPFPPGTRVRPARPGTIAEGLGLSVDAADAAEAGGAFVGHVRDTGVPVRLDIDTLVQKQVAVLAKTGAGKSYVVGVLVEELAKAGVPVVIVDPHGEHTSLRHPNLDASDHRAMARFGVKPRGYRDRVVEFTPTPDVNPEGRPLKLDGRDLGPDEICALARLNGYAANLVHAVVQELRAEGAEEVEEAEDAAGGADADDGENGEVVDAVEADGPGRAGTEDDEADASGPEDEAGPPDHPDGALDETRRLPDAAKPPGEEPAPDASEDAAPAGPVDADGGPDPVGDAPSAGDGPADAPPPSAPRRAGYTLSDLRRRVLSKDNGSWQVVTALEYLENLGLFADPAKGERPVRADDLVKPGQVTVVNLRGTPPDVQEAVVARLATTLFEARKRREVPPMMLVLEEAHAFCPERNLGTANSQQAVRTVASEGRKFGLGLTVVTQRPAKVDKNVLSQANTQIVLRVTNANDLKAIAQSMEGTTSRMEDEVQRLATGSALVACPGLLQPVFVDVRPRETRHGGAGVSVLETLRQDRGPW